MFHIYVVVFKVSKMAKWGFGLLGLFFFKVDEA